MHCERDTAIHTHCPDVRFLQANHCRNLARGHGPLCTILMTSYGSIKSKKKKKKKKVGILKLTELDNIG